MAQQQPSQTTAIVFVAGSTMPRHEIRERLNTMEFAGDPAVPTSNTFESTAEFLIPDPLHPEGLMRVSEQINFLSPHIGEALGWDVYCAPSEDVEDGIIAGMEARNLAKSRAAKVSFECDWELEHEILYRVWNKTASLEDLIVLLAIDGKESVAQIADRLLRRKKTKVKKLREDEILHASDAAFAYRLRKLKVVGRKDHGQHKGHRKLVREHNLQERCIRQAERNRLGLNARPEMVAL